MKTMPYVENYTPEHSYTFTDKCIVTGKEYSVTVKPEELFQHNQTGRIDAFKSLSLEDREFLKTGISPEGWERTFGETACST